MVKGREEFSEVKNLQQVYLSHDIDELIKKILENPSEELIHQLMYYVELRTLRNFQKDIKLQEEKRSPESTTMFQTANPFTPWTNCCASISYPDGFNPQSNWCENNRN